MSLPSPFCGAGPQVAAEQAGQAQVDADRAPPAARLPTDRRRHTVTAPSQPPSRPPSHGRVTGTPSSHPHRASRTPRSYTRRSAHTVWPRGRADRDCSSARLGVSLAPAAGAARRTGYSPAAAAAAAAAATLSPRPSTRSGRPRPWLDTPPAARASTDTI